MGKWTGGKDAFFWIAQKKPQLFDVRCFIKKSETWEIRTNASGVHTMGGFRCSMGLIKKTQGAEKFKWCWCGHHPYIITPWPLMFSYIRDASLITSSMHYVGTCERQYWHKVAALFALGSKILAQDGSIAGTRKHHCWHTKCQDFVPECQQLAFLCQQCCQLVPNFFLPTAKIFAY